MTLTVYLGRAVGHLRQQGRNIPDDLLEHISLLGWEHINFTGIYSWDAEQQMPEGLRSLRFADMPSGPHGVHSPFRPNVPAAIVHVPTLGG